MTTRSTSVRPVTAAEPTQQQTLAAGTTTARLFIEAGPGTGKTTVSAHRFGVSRYQPDARGDLRAVVAVSFTRAATLNLVRRIRRLWGSRAIAWPHRVVTLDAIMVDLLQNLLRAGVLHWPNGHTDLKVEDSWSSFSGSTWNRTTYGFSIVRGHIRISGGFVPKSRSSVPSTVSMPLLEDGVCTHQDVRDVLELALTDSGVVSYLRDRLGATIRALIVDEVFDANDLDIQIIEMAVDAGVAVTLVGDPWQALYVFRGAKPETVPLLIHRKGFRSLELTHSFRWQHPGQEQLAKALRSGHAVSLPVASHENDLAGLDVVLALWWKELWELGPGVLPLAFHAFKGSHEEAAATLLLNHATRNIFSLDAIYLNDALTALAIPDRDVVRQIAPDLQEVTETLRVGSNSSVTAAYHQLADVISRISPRRLRPVHYRYTERLAFVQARLSYPGRPIPGLTTHQAKGSEWDAVGVRLAPDGRKALARGLQLLRDTDRKLYVACTRARFLTTEVT